MKLVRLTLTILLLPLCALASVATPDADWWQPDVIYVQGDIQEYEPQEEYYLALSEVGVTNINFEPDLNPQLWQPIGMETVPEPGTLALLGTGILGALARLRRSF